MMETQVGKTQIAPQAAAQGTLAYLPVASFGAAMGLTGLALAWRLAHATWGIPGWIGDALAAVALLGSGAVAAGYLVKALAAPRAVRNEFAHPVAGKLFGTPLISLLLVPLLLAGTHPGVARVLWAAGTLGMTALAWHVVSGWLRAPQAPAAASPVWIVPVVGLLDVPLAMPALHLAAPLHGVMMFGLSVGLAFAVPIWTLVFARLLFQEPLPAAQQPALMLLVAPFAVGFSSYVTVTGSVDGFATGLYMAALFVLAVLLPRLLRPGREFRLSWWSVSFPLAATSLAALRYAADVHHAAADAIAVAVLALATAVIVGLLWRTMAGIAAGELRALSQ